MADTLGMFPRMKFCLGAFRWYRTRVALNSGSSRYRSREECTSYSRVLFARSGKIQCSSNCVYGGWPKSIFSFQVTSAPLVVLRLLWKLYRYPALFDPRCFPYKISQTLYFTTFGESSSAIRWPLSVSPVPFHSSERALSQPYMHSFWFIAHRSMQRNSFKSCQPYPIPTQYTNIRATQTTPWNSTSPRQFFFCVSKCKGRNKICSTNECGHMIHTRLTGITDQNKHISFRTNTKRIHENILISWSIRTTQITWTWRHYCHRFPYCSCRQYQQRQYIVHVHEGPELYYFQQKMEQFLSINTIGNAMQNSVNTNIFA